MKPILTFEDFLDFCKQQGDSRYDYWSPQYCAVAQYCIARVGYKQYMARGWLFYVHKLIPNSSGDHPHELMRPLAHSKTFKELAERLEAAIHA